MLRDEIDWVLTVYMLVLGILYHSRWLGDYFGLKKFYRYPGNFTVGSVFAPGLECTDLNFRQRNSSP